MAVRLTDKILPLNDAFVGMVDNSQILDENTASANILVSDASVMQSVVMSGDATIIANGTVTVAAGILRNIVEDTTPQLGGELDAQANTIGFTLQTATGDGNTTIDWTTGNKFKFTFGAFDETFIFSPAPGKPCNLLLMMVQDGIGTRTVTLWPGTVKWPGGTAPILSTGASAVDIVSFFYDGTNYYGQFGLDFS